MLKTRVITAAITLPLLLLVLNTNNGAIFTLVFALVGLSTYELAHMMLPRLEAVFAGKAQNDERVGVPAYSSWLCVAITLVIFTSSVLYSAEAGRGVCDYLHHDHSFNRHFFFAQQ